MSEEGTETKEPAKEKPAAAEQKSNAGSKLAVIRVRGQIKVKTEVNDTMKMLNLFRKNYCVIVDQKQRGMITKVKDYVTYGDIDKETEDLLIKNKQEKTKDKEGKETTKKFFRLNPPKKGFGRKGIKVHFSKSGALGYRGDKINDLIKRMM